MGQPTVVHDFPSKLSKPPHRGETIAEVMAAVEAAEAAGSIRITEAEADGLDDSLAADSGQFFTVRLLGHVETCSEEDCRQDTRLGAHLNDGEAHELRPFCKDHIWVLIADFMVGA